MNFFLPVDSYIIHIPKHLKNEKNSRKLATFAGALFSSSGSSACTARAGTSPVSTIFVKIIAETKDSPNKLLFMWSGIEKNYITYKKYE